MEDYVKAQDRLISQQDWQTRTAPRHDIMVNRSGAAR
jgi:hypothetical protein